MNLTRLLAAGGPFIDLRSEKEFAAGAVPGACNLPLLTDDERHQVGLTYKRAGQAAAITLGETLVSGAVREARIKAWLAFAGEHPNCWLYCWRGGLRSEIVQRWLAERGVNLPRVHGGFKALRSRCLSTIAEAPGRKNWLILGGRTGTGKTVLLLKFSASIDLEGLAHHRGSAFGGTLSEQPTPIGFENALAVTCLRHRSATVLLEDESRTIGRLAVPPSWHETMQQAPLVILEAELADRAGHIAREYVWEPLAEGMAASTLRERLHNSLDRIARRLGGLRHREVSAELDRGFENGNHSAWIERLLVWYYDPMYDYQLKSKLDRVVFRGSAVAVEAFLRDRLETDEREAVAREAVAGSGRGSQPELNARGGDRDRAGGPQRS